MKNAPHLFPPPPLSNSLSSPLLYSTPSILSSPLLSSLLLSSILSSLLLSSLFPVGFDHSVCSDCMENSSKPPDYLLQSMSPPGLEYQQTHHHSGHIRAPVGKPPPRHPPPCPP